MRYLVTWSIDIDADSPVEAARKALAIHRDPESIADVFTVQACTDSGTPCAEPEEIDLQDECCEKCGEPYTAASMDGGRCLACGSMIVGEG